MPRGPYVLTRDRSPQSADRTSARVTPPARIPNDSSAAESTWACTPSIAPATSASGVPVPAGPARNCRSARRALAASHVMPTFVVMVRRQTAMRSVPVLDATRRAPGRGCGRGSPVSLTALAHLPPRVFTSLSPAARLRASTRVDSSQAIRVSKAARAVPRSGGGCAVPGLPPNLAQRRCRNGKAANRRRPGGGSGSSGRSWPGHPSGGCRDIPPEWPQRAAHPPDPAPATPDSPAYAPCFGHERALNEGLRGHRRVAGRLRRVVVARRCTQHHLRRVMVETPPRAGPSPPPTDRPVFLGSAGRLEPPAGTFHSAPVGGPPPQRG